MGNFSHRVGPVVDLTHSRDRRVRADVLPDSLPLHGRRRFPPGLLALVDLLADQAAAEDDRSQNQQETVGE